LPRLSREYRYIKKGIADEERGISGRGKIENRTVKLVLFGEAGARSVFSH